MRKLNTGLILSLMLLLSFNSYSQWRVIKQIDTMILKNGKKIIGNYVLKKSNKIKICKGKSRKDCNIYDINELDYIKTGLTKYQEKQNKNTKRRNEKLKKKGKELLSLETSRVLKPIKIDNEYNLLDLTFKGENFDFYTYNAYIPPQGGRINVATLVMKSNASKSILYFSNYSSKKQIKSRIENKFKCKKEIFNAIENEIFKFANKYNLDFYILLDKCQYLK